MWKFSSRSKSLGLALVLCALAALGSLLATLDWYADWGLCGNDLCADPRWRALGKLFGLPLAGWGSLLYLSLIVALWSASFGLSERASCDVHSVNTDLAPLPAPALLLASMALGTHLYLTWVQTYLLHAFCLLCVGIAICGSLSAIIIGWVTFSRMKLTHWVLSLGVGMAVPVIALAIAQHEQLRLRTDEVLVPTSGGPAVYMPHETSVNDEVLLQAMRACKVSGPASAPVTIELFTDLACQRCQELELKVWPQVEAMLAAHQDHFEIVRRFYLLEGHRAAWKASVALLSTIDPQLFALGQQALIERREAWYRNGAVEPILTALPGFKPSAAYSFEVLEQAAKRILREDVLRAEALKVPGVPCVTIGIKDSSQPPTTIQGVQSPYAYYTAILKYMPRSE